MFLAKVNNELLEASKRAKGKCPLCGADVKAKCGNVKVNHWAHQNKEECDS